MKINNPLKFQTLDPLIQEIVRARKTKKLTQSELAQISGVSRRTIILIESGGDCTLSTLRRVTMALGLEMVTKPKHLPTLDDLKRENEALFSSMRQAQNEQNRGH